MGRALNNEACADGGPAVSGCQQAQQSFSNLYKQASCIPEQVWKRFHGSRFKKPPRRSF